MKMTKKHGCTYLLLMLWLLIASTSATAVESISQRGDISEYRLGNGLSIVLAPDTSGNAVFFNMIYRVGSLDDPPGKSGMAHLLEHLMFSGTRLSSGVTLAQELSQQGIQFNATTSYDRTRYTAMLDADPDTLNFLLALEAERMTQLHFQQETLSAEREVVFREMELMLDQPVAALGQAMMSAASPNQGLGRPVLGTRDEVNAIALEDLKGFYERHYRPDQAVIVLTGNFDTELTLAQIQQHFAAVSPPRDSAPQTQLPSLSLDSAISVQVEAGDTDWVAIAYPLPEVNSPVNVSLAALLDIMAGMPHGRLHKALVESGKTHGIMGLQLNFRHAGYFIFSAPVVAGHPVDDVKASMIRELEGLADHPLSAAELERFQATVAAQEWQVFQNPGLLAEILSESAALGNWQLILDRFELFADLTLADVQQQAEQLLNADQRLSGQLLAADLSSEPAQTSQTNLSPVERSGATTDQPDPVRSSAASALPEFDLPGFNQQLAEIEASVQRSALDNGLQLLLRPQLDSGKPVRGRMILRFGDETSLSHKRALADLTGTLLTRGTETTDFQTLVDQVNKMGAGLHIYPSGGVVTVQLETPAHNLETILMILGEVLQKPAFTQQDFDLIKRQQQQALRQSNEQPAQVASRAYHRHTERHPVGHLLRHRGNEELLSELDNITLDDVRAFHTQFYGSNHGELALSGDFDPDVIKPLLEQLFGDWNSGAPFSRSLRLHEPSPEARLHVRANALLTGHYLAYMHFPANNADEDAAALMIAEQILGRNQVHSRLSQRLRQERGLTYDVRSSIKVANFGTDSWVRVQSGYPITQGERLASIVRDEVSKLIDQGITQEELLQAKQSILHGRQLSISQDQNILAQLPTQAYRGITYLDWIERNNAFAGVTLEEVNTAIRKHLGSAIWIEVLADRSASKH